MNTWIFTFPEKYKDWVFWGKRSFQIHIKKLSFCVPHLPFHLPPHRKVEAGGLSTLRAVLRTVSTISLGRILNTMCWRYIKSWASWSICWVLWIIIIKLKCPVFFSNWAIASYYSKAGNSNFIRESVSVKQKLEKKIAKHLKTKNVCLNLTKWFDCFLLAVNASCNPFTSVKMSHETDRNT